MAARQRSGKKVQQQLKHRSVLPQALAAHQEGRLDEAVRLYAEASRQEPGQRAIWINLGVLLKTAGRRDEAEQVYRCGLQHLPDDADLHANLANLLSDTVAGAKEAVEHARQACLLDPQHPFAANNLAKALLKAGMPTEAEVVARQRLAQTPDDVAARYNLAAALLHQQTGTDEARGLLQLCAGQQPDNPEIWNLLGILAAQRNEYDQAEAAYRRVLALQPGYKDVYNNLGNLAMKYGRPGEAIRWYQQGLALAPDDPQLHAGIASALYDHDQLADAISHAEQAVALAPDNGLILNSLARLRKAEGRLQEAVQLYRQALQYQDDAVVYENLLLALQYAGGVSREEVRAAHFEYGQRFEAPLRDCRGGYSNTAVVGRPLRVGYVSADFCNHSVSYFAEPLLASHDRSVFQVICYHNRPVEDHVTARFRSHADEFYNISALTDEQLAAKVRADRIDILVDLTGHTAKNRLMTFARKPAPVQVTWLGHPNTTGLTAMDWRLTDVACDPEGSEDWYTERLWRLPDVFCCYRPMIRHPERRHDTAYQPGPSPCLKQGYITFGCCNNYAKLTDEVIALWSRLLHQVPRSRLLLEAMGLGEGYLRERLLERFEKHGIAAERLDLRNRQGEQQYLLYHEIDIALDPFPANGGTTSCDLLWMGVPLVTLRGEQFVSRMGSSLVGVVGHPEWVAGNEDEYIGIASHLASDPAALDGIRQQLRGEVEASPLMDEPRFARNVEQAYQEMWKQWAEEQEQETRGMAVEMPQTMDPEQVMTAFQQGDSAAMEEYCRSLLEKDPHDRIATANLGCLLARKGDYQGSIELYRKGLEKHPDDMTLLSNMAYSLSESRRWHEAYPYAKRVTERYPDYYYGWLNLGWAANMSARHHEGEVASQQALALRPTSKEALNNLGCALKEQGRLHEAVEVYQRLVTLEPDFEPAHLNLMLGLQYDPDACMADIAKAARTFARQFEAPCIPVWPQHQNAPEPWRRLRLGFISPDFNDHSVMYFVEPVLARLDRRQWEICCYYTYPEGSSDHLTERVMRYADRFTYLGGKQPDEQARIIQADGIDILIDLAGHTGKSGLVAMARKPAPIQVTWLGYPGTTGLTAIDWRITDNVADRDVEELKAEGLKEEALQGVPPLKEQYSEKLAFLPSPFCVYRPCIRNPLQRYWTQYLVRQTPALQNGFITFGSCNNIAKLTPVVLQTWGRLLQKIPGARLLIEGKGFTDQAYRETYRTHCAAQGIDVTRLTLMARDIRNQYLIYHQIDIALDPFPLTGGTTSFDVLWMGVPLVTMQGSSFRSRMSISLLTAAGLTEWIARDEDEYIKIAVRLASDIPALNSHRLQQRQKIEQSPLMDEARFVRLFDEVLRQAWLKWCAKKLAGDDPSAQHRQFQQWLQGRPHLEPLEPQVFLATGEQISMATARHQLQQALENAQQDGRQSENSTMLLPAWQEVVQLATCILDVTPKDPMALAVLAEVDYAHGKLQAAVSYLANAVDAAPQNDLFYQRLIEWYHEAGNEQAVQVIVQLMQQRGLCTAEAEN